MKRKIWKEKICFKCSTVHCPQVAPRWHCEDYPAWTAPQFLSRRQIIHSICAVSTVAVGFCLATHRHQGPQRTAPNLICPISGWANGHGACDVCVHRSHVSFVYGSTSVGSRCTLVSSWWLLPTRVEFNRRAHGFVHSWRKWPHHQTHYVNLRYAPLLRRNTVDTVFPVFFRQSSMPPSHQRHPAWLQDLLANATICGNADGGASPGTRINWRATSILAHSKLIHFISFFLFLFCIALLSGGCEFLIHRKLNSKPMSTCSTHTHTSVALEWAAFRDYITAMGICYTFLCE